MPSEYIPTCNRADRQPAQPMGYHKDPRTTGKNPERWSLAKDLVDDFDYRALLSPETRKALEEWEQKNMKVTK